MPLEYVLFLGDQLCVSPSYRSAQAERQISHPGLVGHR